MNRILPTFTVLGISAVLAITPSQHRHDAGYKNIRTDSKALYASAPSPGCARFVEAVGNSRFGECTDLGTDLSVENMRHIAQSF